MHIVTKLYSPEFDFPQCSQPLKASVMLATLPRSGSTVFAEYMWRTGVMGAPMEYPNLVNRQGTFERLGSTSWADYWGRIQAVRTGPNGIFSYKMFMSNMLEIARSHPDLHRRIVSTHVVYLTREDTLGQAISYSRAIRSRAWFADVLGEKPVEYSQQHITSCIRSIHRQKAFWENVFRVTGTEVLRVTYEQFQGDPEEVMERVAGFIGVELPACDLVDIPILRVQRDTTSDEWRERYLAESNVSDGEIPQRRVSPDFEFVAA